MASLQRVVKEEDPPPSLAEVSRVKEEVHDAETVKAEEGGEKWSIKEEASPVEISTKTDNPCEIEVKLEPSSESEDSPERAPRRKARKRAHPLRQQQNGTVLELTDADFELLRSMTDTPISYLTNQPPLLIAVGENSYPLGSGFSYQRNGKPDRFFFIIIREMEEPPALVGFFRERGIAEDVIKRMERDKIDISVIPLMGDNELQKYIPHYGDRLAVVAYCLTNQPYPGRPQPTEPPQSGPCGPREDISKRHMGNTNAKKKARRVELGWMNYNDKGCNFKQVRTANGGGTKHISINKQATVWEVRKMAKRIFFPFGSSRFFHLRDVDCDVRDFSHRRLDENLTVGDLYEAYKVKILRLYLFTKKRGVQSSQNASREGASNRRQQECNGFSFATHRQTVENNANRATENAQAMPRLEQTFNEKNEIWEDENQENCAIVKGRRMEDRNSEDFVKDARILPQTGKASVSAENPPLQDYADDGIKPRAQIFEADGLDDSIHQASKDSVTVVVRKGSCLSDMMAAFTDPAIIDKKINICKKLPNGVLELDIGSGLFRDCLSEFWSEFFNRCTLGTDVKAPFLRHEFEISGWQAIARVLLKGWVAEKYFPIHLPLPFLEEALYGTVYSSVTDAFMLYISKHDREVLQHALNNFESVDQDTLLDILDSYECHRMPTKENLASLLFQLGHKALIQMPMFVIQCWKPVLKDLAKTLSPEKLVEIIEERVPSHKKVKALLKFPEDMNAQQSTVARHLQRYIRELDDSTLQRFLRFCTGADVLFGRHITVQFTEKKDFECRPKAHMCGCLLLLPLKYQNYPDLRTGFNAVLNNSVWTMDII